MMESSEKAQRRIKTIPLHEKVEIIKCFKQGKSRSELRTEFGVPRSTLSRILANAEQLEEEAEKRHGETKRLKRPANPKLEECLVEWVEMCQARHVPLPGQVLKNKAAELAQRLGIEGFGASNCWLAGFKKRNAEITFNKVYPRAEKCTALDMDACYSWIPPLNEVELLDERDDDKPRIIFKADETDLSGSESSSLQPINLCGTSLSEDHSKAPRSRRSADGSELEDGVSKEDKFSLWAKLWATKLRELPTEQALHAEKLINEVLYEASLGNLGRKCSLNLPTLNGNS